MAVGADILAVLLSLSVVSCLFSEGLECGSRGQISSLCYCLSQWLVACLVKVSSVAVGADILAVLLSLSVVSCLFSEGLECGSRGRYPRCAIVSLSG